MNSGEGNYVCKLSPELQKIAKKELHEDPSRRAGDIEAIRTWINQQPHLQIRTDDMSILRFLRAAKFSIERTKEKIDNFYTLRNALPEWFGDRSIKDPKIMKLINLGVCVPLNGYTKEGRKVVVWRSGVFDPKEFSMDDVFRMSSMLTDMLLLMDEQITIAGVEGINDMTGITLAHITSISLSSMKKSMTLLEATPIRFKGMHYWKLPSAFEKFYNLFKSIMKEKMKKRLYIHSDLKSLQSSFPLEMLPAEFGGTGGKMDDLAAAFAKVALEHENYFQEESKYKVDESKRPGKPKSQEDLFGIDGSFRKLEID